MKSTAITFPNVDGHKLGAILDEPLGIETRGYAIFAHCFTCGKNLKTASRISSSLTREGFAVLRFDFTGLGQSGGDFAQTSFITNLQDLESAAQFLRENYRPAQLLIGHSLGGTAVIHAAAKLDEINAFCTIGAPAEASHVRHLIASGIDEIEKSGQAIVNIGGRPFPIGQRFLADLESVSTANVLHKMRKALLIFHSPQDEIVEVSNAAEIYTAAFHPKSFVSLDGANHLLTNANDANYVATVIASWALRYLENESTEPLVKTEHQVMAQIEQGSFTTEIVSGRHHTLADEPEEFGGNDLGPSPYQLLGASLGACTAMTLKMYADRKDWKFKKITVEVSHSKSHKVDAEAVENTAQKMERINRVVTIEADLTAEQRIKLIEIANKCPVHRTLTESDIEVVTVEGSAQ